jgi:hypothetical protein
MEHTVLTDTACEGGGMALDTSGPFKGQDELLNALAWRSPGTLDKTITGVFVGKFDWRPKQTPSRILHLKEVLDLKVSPIPDSGIPKPKDGDTEQPRQH